MKLSVLALTLGVIFNSSAFAATEQWDTPDPWGASTPVQYAEWNQFLFSPPSVKQDNTPDVTITAGTTATLKENSGGGFISGSQNIYSYTTTTDFTATLSGGPAASTTGFFDVYLRVAAFGNQPNLTASLNGQSVTATTQRLEYIETDFGPGYEGEYYWVWKDVAASNLYTFNFKALSAHMSLDQLALATVSVSAVPEPETYSMMALGLGLMAFAARRSSKKA